MTARPFVGSGDGEGDEFNPAPNGEFYIGDKVRVVIEGTLVGYNREDGHYYLKGNSTGADHIDWLHTLHWATEFHVIEPGSRDIGDGATNADEAWNGTTKGGADE